MELTTVSELQLWSLIVGFLLPPVLAILQRTKWDTAVRACVAFVACLAAAAGTVYFTDPVEFDAQSYTMSFLLIFVSAISTYNSWWKPSTITTRIEGKTDY